MQYWPMIIFGWPSAILGGILLLVGIFRRNAMLSIAGAVVAAGFCLYISLNPAPFRWLGLVAVTGNFMSAIAVRRNATVLATLSIIPFFLVAVYLAYAVLNE